MKLRTKALLVALMAFGAATLLTGCGSEPTPYEENDKEDYTVSVKYDANGGTFTTNTSVIVDSYQVSDKIALLSPDDSRRGNDAFTAVKAGHFLAGWYAERTETGKDEEGNPIYTYANKWDFEKGLLEVDKSKEYTSAEPVMTLYAAWVPMFEFAIYSLDTGEYMSSYTFDPTVENSLQLPKWDEETGALEMFKFPDNAGYTFTGLYLDEAGTQAVEGEALVHNGVVNEATGVAENPVMKVYADWKEGEWFHIYNAEQFIENASVNGCYEIHADLDFTDKNWPSSLMYGNFAGRIEGNGHTMSNIQVTQTNSSKVNAGLFGALTENAVIQDVNFSNVTFTIEKGIMKMGSSYGLFAGSIAEKAQVSNVSVLSSKLQIDSKAFFGVDDYSIGLVCGMGNPAVLTTADISYAVVGENPENMQITVNGNEVIVENK